MTRQFDKPAERTQSEMARILKKKKKNPSLTNVNSENFEKIGKVKNQNE